VVVALALLDPGDLDHVESIADEHGYEQYVDSGERFEAVS